MLNKMGSNKMSRTKKDKSLDTEITQDLFGYNIQRTHLKLFL